MNKPLLILNEIVERVNNNKETILNKPKLDKIVSIEYQDIMWYILRKSGYSVMFEASEIIIRKEHP